MFILRILLNVHKHLLQCENIYSIKIRRNLLYCMEVFMLWSTVLSVVSGWVLCCTPFTSVPPYCLSHYRINILQSSSFIVIISICANNQRGSPDNSLHYFSIRFTKVGGTFLVHFTLRTIYSKICKYFRINKQQMLYLTELPASPKLVLCKIEKSARI